MRLFRCSDQDPETLEEHYRESPTMRQLIERLRSHPDGRTGWGLTSINHLMLFAEDNAPPPWLVQFIGSPVYGYTIWRDEHSFVEVATERRGGRGDREGDGR